MRRGCSSNDESLVAPVALGEAEVSCPHQVSLTLRICEPWGRGAVSARTLTLRELDSRVLSERGLGLCVEPPSQSQLRAVLWPFLAWLGLLPAVDPGQPASAQCPSHGWCPAGICAAACDCETPC